MLIAKCNGYRSMKPLAFTVQFTLNLTTQCCLSATGQAVTQEREG